MEIVMVPIAKLRPSEHNPRQITEDQAAALRESLERFGFVDPLVVNRHKSRLNVIVGGHQRYHVAMGMGIAEVPCVFVSLEEEREKELNLRLNKNLGSWDYDLLANFDTEFLMDVGFTSTELNRIFELGLDEPDPPDPGGRVVKCPKCGHKFQVLKERE